MKLTGQGRSMIIEWLVGDEPLPKSRAATNSTDFLLQIEAQN